MNKSKRSGYKIRCPADSARCQCEQLCIENTCALENHVPSGESFCPWGAVYNTIVLSEGVNFCLEIVTHFVLSMLLVSTIIFGNENLDLCLSLYPYLPMDCQETLFPLGFALSLCYSENHWLKDWQILGSQGGKRWDRNTMFCSDSLSDSSPLPPPTNAVFEGSLGPCIY